ncbi:MAG: spore germination protein [Deltaproteobacteria bacterium]
MKDWLKQTLQLITFNEPTKKEELFVLTESDKESTEKSTPSSTPEEKEKKKSEIKKPISIEESNKDKKSADKNPNKVSKTLDKNLAFLKEKYSADICTDVKIREFDITKNKNEVSKAFIIFIDGITDKTVINNNILQPLMLFTSLEPSQNISDMITFVERNLAPQNQLQKSDDFNFIITSINMGSCVLFIDGAEQSIVFDVKSWEHRTVDKPTNEMIVRGPQEGFGEVLRVNTALIRKNLRNENLMTESITVGKRSNTLCCVMYLKNLANPSLVEEVKRRLSSIDIDYANDSGIIEKMIEDDPLIPNPLIIATERPDRAALLLSEGRVAILVDGNPYVLIVPATFFSLVHSPEDNYSKVFFVNLMRVIRYIGMFFGLLLPGIYVAVTNFHNEMIPTDLVLAISAAREKVPFPSVIEILIMEISFELIREAGIRMPGAIGPTLGIIGALILGQAAVAASIVSPILIIIVALTGIGSLAIPNFSLSFSIRILRFVYIILGALAGLFGITIGFFIHTCYLASTKSFGVPFLAPLAPKTGNLFSDVILRPPIWTIEKRPDYINPLDDTAQPEKSRKWDK